MYKPYTMYAPVPSGYDSSKQTNSDSPTSLGSFRLLCVHYSVMIRYWLRNNRPKKSVLFLIASAAILICYLTLSSVDPDYSNLYKDTASNYKSTFGDNSKKPDWNLPNNSDSELEFPNEELETVDINKPSNKESTQDSSIKEKLVPKPKAKPNTDSNKQVEKPAPKQASNDDNNEIPQIDKDTLSLSLSYPKALSKEENLAFTLDGDSTDWFEHKKFGIVIDAGSSGSRVHVYSWDDPAYVLAKDIKAEKVNSFPVIEKGVKDQSAGDSAWQLKSKPGISTFASNPDDVESHIKPLMDFALEKIPESKISSTPVYLMATAGLRLVEEKARKQILTNVCNFVGNNYSFDISGGCDIHFRVISGELEGIYGWIMVNYLKGGFDKKLLSYAQADKGTDSSKNQGVKIKLPSKPKRDDYNLTSYVDIESRDKLVDTFGFLDMGGASTQIAFEPIAEMAKKHSDDLTTVNLRTINGNEVNFNIFVTTFLGFGMNEARRRYLTELILHSVNGDLPTVDNESTKEKEQPKKEKVEEKSENKDDEKKEVKVEARNSLKPRAVIPSKSKKYTKIEDILENLPYLVVDPCLPKDLKYEDKSHLPKAISSADKQISFVGSGDFKLCNRIQNDLLLKELPCKDTPCLFNGVHVPINSFEVHKFLGVSEYWYSSDEVYGLGGVYDYNQFMAASEELCSRNWKEIEELFNDKKYPSVRDIETIKLQCFKSGWIINVLHDGLGMPKDLPEIPINPVTNKPIDDQSKEELAVEESMFESVNEIHDFGLSWTLGSIIMHVAATIPQAL